MTLCRAFTKAAVRSGSFFCCAISQMCWKLSVITLCKKSSNSESSYVLKKNSFLQKLPRQELHHPAALETWCHGFRAQQVHWQTPE